MQRAKRIACVAVLMLVMASPAAGQTFSTPVNVSRSPSVSSFLAQVAVDANGNINVIWVEQTGSVRNIYYSRSADRGQTFSGPAPVSTNGQAGIGELVVDSEGTAHIVWSSGPDTYYARSADGLTVTAPLLVSSRHAATAVDAQGTIHLAWLQTAPLPNPLALFEVWYSRSTDGGQNFSAPSRIALTEPTPGGPRIAAGANGKVCVVWTARPDPGNQEIYLSSSADGGQSFSAPVNVSSSPTLSYIGFGLPRRQLIVDAQGNVHFVWLECLANCEPFLGPNMQLDVHYSRSDGGASFSPPVNISADPYRSLGAELAVDGLGNAYVSWESQQPVPESSFSILEALFSRSTDGGQSFSPPINLSQDTGRLGGILSLDPRVDTDAQGNVSVVWQDAFPSGGGEVVFFRRSVGGASFGPLINLSSTTGRLGNSFLFIDSSSNINVVWQGDSPNTPSPLEIFFTQGVVNRPPVADAGENATVECSSDAGTPVTLDGSGSSDPDLDILSYEWRDASDQIVGTTASVNLTLPLGTHTFTLTVGDGRGGSATDSVTIVVQDTTPPTLTLSQASLTVIVPTATTTSMAVDLSGIASADDTCDDDVQITNNAPALFPIGATTVTFTATDDSGNSSQAQLTVHVVYQFSGFLPPIRSDGSSVFKSGRVIPVKFQLTAADGSVITNANATIQVFKITDVVMGTVEEVTPEAAGASNTDNIFRFDPTTSLYTYNLSTTGYSEGTYILRALVNDQTLYEVLVSIRP